ncbi:reticulon-like protein B21 isoform X2 [Argentina anserina]|uniref:reticulon-like protein B21 isoform X2 n=1 Tax=Argentina anserina TaxID=57926 RepID=UPI0021762B77|nr:reticulon-like protein B21 isoform X2 [Potentilla anserina]
MEVGRRRSDAGVLRTGNTVVAGSVWESRMKLDEVRGGMKVFNGDQENSEESSSTTSNGVSATTPRTRLKRGQSLGGAVNNGKRKTWNSDTGKSELKSSDEKCKELSVSVDGIKNSPSQVRSVRRIRSEGSRESPNGVVGSRRTKIELVKSASDLGKDEGNEKNLGQLRKVKSESTKGGDSPGNAVQLRMVESESNKASPDEFDKDVENSVEVIEKIPVEEEENGSNENCKEFGVCKEMVIPSNVNVVKSDPAELVNDVVADEEDGDEEEDELEEEMDEEIDVEVENISLDIKEINAPVQVKEPAVQEKAPVQERISKIVNEVKVVKEVKKFQFDRKSRNQEVKKLQHVHPKPETISLNLKKQSPVMRRAAVYSNLPKNTSSSNDQYHSFPERHSNLQSLVDLVMWKDVSRSVFIFGIGTFVILSSSYMKDLNISFISVISYMSLVYLAVKFLFRSIICRGAYEVENANSVVGEEEAIWLLKLVLPYLNEFLLKFKALFSGDPATTIKLAVLLFVLARCGSSITIWTMAKVGFFGVFTVPKICSLYSTQITIYAKFWGRRFRDAWDSCTHKKAVTVGIFLLVWNLSSVGARIWAAFILVVAFRYYQQKLVTEEWVEEDVAEEEGAEDTWQGATPVD